MPAEENKAISERIAQAISTGDFAAMKQLMSPKIYKEFERDITVLRAAFPDYHGVNVDTIAEGDKVVNRFTYYGTHQGEFMGVPPTGKQVTFNGISIDQFADGKMVNSWVELNWLEVMKQLGMALPPGW